MSTDTQKYLQIISNIAHVPKSLWYIGTMPNNRAPTVSIIGTRKPTSYGREVGYNIAYELAKRGVVIVSGLALGIDAIAHQAALDAGGTTIAVLPGGLDKIYPYTNRGLAAKIVENGGALLSEHPPGTNIFKSSFVARNRIVSALCDGLLVVEAAAKSGTMHTVGFALDQGKNVMAVPGNITSPASEGCNNLIKTGATPITPVLDVLQTLGLDKQLPLNLTLGSNNQENTILQLIAAGHRDSDQIQALSGLEASIFNQSLTMLEITGQIRALGNNKWSIK